VENQQTNEQPQEQLKKGKRHVWFWVIGSIIALLLIIFLVSKDLFSQVLAWLLIIGLPVLSIAIITLPFLVIWKSKHKFNVINIIISLVISGALTYLVYQGWIYFFNYMFDAIAEGFLSNF